MLNGVESHSSLSKGTTNGEVRYPNVNVRVGGVKRKLDLLMVPTTEYRGQGCSGGGSCTAGGYDAIGGMGMINLEVSKQDADYDFEFRFVEPNADRSSIPVKVDDVYIEFFDIDRGNDDVVEKIIVRAEELTHYEAGELVDLVVDDAQIGFVAREYGDGQNNPTSLTTLDDTQFSLRAQVRYQKRGVFSVKFGVGYRPRGRGGRNFFFSLTDSWPC